MYPLSLLQVMAPKVDAAVATFQLATLRPIQLQVLFSSVAALLGSPGQTNYAAANATLDALSQQAQQLGALSVSVQWGAWASAGMATQDRSTAMRLQRLGLGLIQVESGLNALEASLKSSTSSVSVVAAVPFLWLQFIQAAKKPLAPIFAEFETASATRLNEGSSSTAGVISSPVTAAVDVVVVHSNVQDAVSRILGSVVSASQPLMAAGLDSLGVVELRNSLEGSFGMQLPSTLVFDYPTVDSISEFLAGKLGGKSSSGVAMGIAAGGAGALALRGSLLQSTNKSLIPSSGAAATGPALVVGTTWRSPKSAFAFTTEIDAVGVAPYQRWDLEAENPLAARFGAYFPDIASFDATAFSIPDTEASLMDPQQRLVLECVGEALLSFDPNTTTTSAVVPMASRGVYVGLASSDYGAMVHRFVDKGAFHATSNAVSVACGRVSYTFGMRGPCLSIDTACSASLVATHLAACGLAEGAASVSYATGVHAQCTPTSTSYVWTASMLSPSGRCRALDSSADGYVRGELCGVAVLTTAAVYYGGANTGELNEASAPLAILGSAVNQDGRSSSLTAPNGPAQQEVIRAALTFGGVSAAEVASLSMHGTGTALGDPIEVGAAMTVYSSISGSSLPLTFAASKSWVGHAEPGAGLAGLLLAKHTATQATVIPLLHLRAVNPYVANTLEENDRNFGRGALLPKEFGPQIGNDGKRIVGVSAFAFQGTNAHAVVKSSFFSPENTTSSMLTWKKRRHYVLPEAHLLLQTALSAVPSSGQVSLVADLSSPQLAFLWDHKVMGKSIFPGAGYFEASSRVAGMLLPDLASNGSHYEAVTSAIISAPLMLPALEKVGATVKNSILFNVEMNVRSGALSIKSSVVATGAVTTHVNAAAALLSSSLNGKNITFGKEDTSIKESTVPCNAMKSVLNLDITDETIEASAPSAAVAELHTLTERSGLWMDPAPFDCFLQLGQVFNSGDSREVYVPAGLGALRCAPGACNFARKPEAWAAVIPLNKNGAAISDFHLTSGISDALCVISELEAKSMGKAPTSAGASASTARVLQPATCLYETIWSANNLIEPGESFLADGKTLWQLAQQQSAIIDPAAAAADAISAAQRVLLSGQEGSAIQLQSVGYPGAFSQPFGNAATVNASSTSLMGSALGGLIRTLNRECPQMSWSLAAADPMAPSSATLPASRLMHLSRSASKFDLFGSAAKSSARYTPALISSAAQEALGPYHLMPMPRGSLTSLVPLPVAVDVPQRHPQDQVVLNVRSVGLNFRDVLNVLGMYPGDPGPPGGDCAGIITSGYLRSQNGEILAGPGDAAFGLAFGSLGSHVIASAKTLVPMPQGVSFEEASTMPTVFVTVDTALNRLAQVKQGQRVLLHAAAGGVGLAAVQVLQAAGAQPLVTAGGPFKRSLLRTLGASHAASSRDTVFAQELVVASGPADVALNTLTSSGMVAASLAMVNAGGTFIEISKRDIWSSTRIAQERPDIHYNLLAVDFMSADALHAAMMRVSAGLGESTLHPLPTAGHDMRAVVTALRQMSQARHIGKVVVRPTPPLKSGACDGSVLITGGTGALGSIVTNWLIGQKACHLTLVGRSGLTAGDGAPPFLTAAHGAAITLVKCDASLAEDLVALQQFGTAAPQLTGLFHAGGVLADATAANQSAQSVLAVFAPKAAAYQRLDAVSGVNAMQTSVLFSSVAALLGSVGQLNYSIANSWLDAMAAQKQASGLGVISTQFGAWKGGGMAAITSLKMESMGLGALTPTTGLASLTGLLRHSSAQPAVAAVGGIASQIAASPIDWPTFLKHVQGPGTSYFADFAHLKVEETRGEGSVAASGKPAMVVRKAATGGTAGMDAEPRAEYLRKEVESAAAAIIGGNVSVSEPLMAAGLDSLGAVELRNSLEGRLGLQLPSTLVFDYPTIDAISEYVGTQTDPVDNNEEDDENIASAVLVDSSSLGNITLVDSTGSMPTTLLVTGVASRTPQNALHRGVAIDVITSTPTSRWDVELQLTQDMPARFGGFLSAAYYFDATSFNTSSAEAILMDPQQRIVLELTGEVFTVSSLSSARPQAGKRERGLFNSIKIYFLLFPVAGSLNKKYFMRLLTSIILKITYY
jgi:NADPH:quinone reductase-like Zn-dependent oxidoreductase/3-oxoacyl-(acyl-carrier-protein) synthase/acyl carrier protein